MSTDDWELLAHWRQGDGDAGNELLKRYYKPIARYFANKVSNRDEAADLISQTFLACTERRDHIRDANAFRSYLFGVAHHCLHSFFAGKQEYVFTDVETCKNYGHDETEDYVFPPNVVVTPANAQQISAILKIANQYKIPTTPIGAKTGLSGGALSIYQGIGLSTERLNKIIEIERKKPTNNY